jgi:TonB family protein
MSRRAGLIVVAALVLLTACSRRGERADERARAGAPTVKEETLARDESERIVMPLAPPGTGEWRVEQVAPARAELDPPLPAAEPGDPDTLPAREPVADPGALQPPIARGFPRLLRAGGGGRVTLDVRVDEQGEVSDVELVASDADSAMVAAATAAAFATRYHPARLGGRAVAVWSRQVFDVRRGR